MKQFETSLVLFKNALKQPFFPVIFRTNHKIVFNKSKTESK